MKKWNKRLILLLVLVLVIGVIGGCDKKLPEGVGQEFYDDMVFVLDDMSETILKIKDGDNFLDALLSGEGLSVIMEYKDKGNTLTVKELSIIDNLEFLHANLEMYYENIMDEDTFKQKIDEISELMEVDIDLNDYLF